MAETTKTPAAPADLGEHGRALWSALRKEYLSWTPHEAALLHRACKTADIIAGLDEIVERNGLLVKSISNDEPRTNPALVELRQQELTLARLFAAMRLPDAEGLTPQKRQLRGVHGGSGRRWGAA